MLKFFNVNTGETREADTPEKISALWGSSDRGPNVFQGQDFGWRLAPEVVAEMKKIKSNNLLIQRIASRYNILYTDVDEKQILTYISEKTAPKDAAEPKKDYTEEYEERIRELTQRKKKASTNKK